MDVVKMRLLSQQLCAPQFINPEDLVSYFGALQGQEFRLMRWAVCMRTKKPSAAAFEKAFNSGRIIRSHLMRGTWQLISGEDYGWMMDLFADKARKTISGWMRANGISLPEEEQTRVSEVLCRTASEKRSATKEDFAEALSANGIFMDDNRLSYHIRMAELNRLLCSGDLLHMKASYSPVADKIGSPLEFTKDEALASIAKKYFQSHAPASLDDYVWWTGLSKTDCKRSMMILGKGLESIHVDGKEYFFPADCRTKGVKKGTSLLVAPYDEYLIGYKSREFVLAPEFRHRAHNMSGNFSPIVVHDGIVCGNWSPFGNNPETNWFSERYDTSSEWERYLRFLKGASTTPARP